MPRILFISASISILLLSVLLCCKSSILLISSGVKSFVDSLTLPSLGSTLVVYFSLFFLASLCLSISILNALSTNCFVFKGFFCVSTLNSVNEPSSVLNFLIPTDLTASKDELSLST